MHLWSDHSPRRKRCRAVQEAAAATLEHLETRVLLSFTGTVASAAATLTSDAAPDALIISVKDGFLTHNRSGVDSGFATEFDFDSAQEGEQRVAAIGLFTLRIDAGDGDDQIRLNDIPAGTLLALSVNGDGGNDLVLSNNTSQAMTLSGGDGDDSLNGGQGTDLISGDLGADQLLGWDGRDSLYGGDGQDALSGGTGDNYMNGDEGNDTLYGGPGADTMLGGDGNDSLNGEDGADSMEGGAGDDIITNSSGHDTILGGPGADLLVGYDSELFIWNPGDGQDSIPSAGAGDVLRVNGSAGNDTFSAAFNSFEYRLRVTWSNGAATSSIVATLSNIELLGGDGNDVFNINTIANILVDGQAGSDTLNFTGTFGNDSYIIGNTTITAAQGTINRAGIEQAFISGGGGNDTLDASGATQSVTLLGGVGNDTLIGGAGADSLNGGWGDDQIIGGPAADLLLGDANNDTFIWFDGDGDDSIDGGTEWDTFEVRGTPGDDVFTAFDDRIQGAKSAVARPNIEYVQVNGLAGNDLLNASGSTLPITLIGGDGDDTLTGGSGADSLSGDAGVDVLRGGAGPDTLLGGDGDDRLLFEPSAGDDSLDGQAGSDLLSIALTAQDEALILTGSTISGIGQDIVRFAGFEAISADGQAGSDTLVISGTAENDSLILGASGVSGLGAPIAIVGFEQLVVDGGDGNDVFDVQSTALATTLGGGDGNDTFAISGTGAGALAVDGQNGSDSYTVNFGNLLGLVSISDSGTSLPSAALVQPAQRAASGDTNNFNAVGTDGDDVIELSATEVRLGAQAIALGSNLVSVKVQGRGGNDHIIVSDTPAATTLNGGAGNDTFEVAAGISSPIEVAGSTDNGILVINGTGGRDIIDVASAGRITANRGRIHYSQISRLLLKGSSGRDSFRVRGVLTPVSISGEDGNDVVATDLLSASVRFDGGAGRDVLKVNGTNKPETIAVRASGIGRSIGFSNAEGVQVSGLRGDDRLDASRCAISVSLFGGAGNDLLTGGSGNDRLSGGDGNDTLRGRGGADVLLGDRGFDDIYQDGQESINLGGTGLNGGKIIKL